MHEKISRLTAATDQLYWICKYAHLGAVANQDENAGLLAAIEQLADQVNMMAMEVEGEGENFCNYIPSLYIKKGSS